LPATSVIFALEPLELKTLVQWIKAFYVLLGARLSFADACKRAFDLHPIPIMLYPQPAPDALAREFRGVAPVGAQAQRKFLQSSDRIATVSIEELCRPANRTCHLVKPKGRAKHFRLEAVAQFVSIESMSYPGYAMGSR
jgi:hypothetical protein